MLFQPLKHKWNRVTVGEELFGLPKTSLTVLQQIQDDMAALEQLYSLYTAVLTTIQDRGAQPWSAAKDVFEALATEVADFQVKSRRMPKTMKDWPAYKDCRKLIDDLVAVVPLLQGLAHKSVQDRHWVELSRVVGGAPLLLPSQGLLLSQVLGASLLEHREEVEDLCTAATKEEGVEKKLKAIAAQWEQETFTFAEHKQRGPVVLKPAETAELKEKLEDATMVLGSLAASRYSVPFRPELVAMSSKLGAVSEIMEQWLAVQSMWSYMEAVFSGGDIVKQLPAEAKRFSGIDKSFIKAMTHARETGRVLEACTGSHTLSATLPVLLEQLEVCQKSLAAYLGEINQDLKRMVGYASLLKVVLIEVLQKFQLG